jgi:methionyl-tRNA formyltransferase
MKKKSNSIVFFGSGPVAAESLKALADEFLIESVITKSVPKHHKGPIAPVEKVATELELPILYANNKSELNSIIECAKPDSQLGVLVDYGVMVSKNAIDSFAYGIINSHFSLLPEWRGADPITFSLLSGQNKTGVSLMLIETELDTGKVITKKSVQIENNDDIITLTNKLIMHSNKLLIEFIPKYIDGTAKPRRQSHPDRATYSRKINKSDGKIDWAEPATQIEREIRAYFGWPKSYTTLNNNNIVITKAHILNEPESESDIKCGDNKYIAIDKLIAPSGKKMSINDYLNGQKNKIK